MSEKNCFIVMPITTPSDYIDLYSGDKDHFRHVLEHLFVPAIKSIGLKPVLPVTKGAEVIHAEIIRNIESSDYVLCDMSILNPNVFFELGIRTAINRPISLVKDDATPKVPFDTNIINNYTYLSNFSPWTLEHEIEKLSQHLNECFKNTERGNSLWKYFSLSTKAMPLEKPSKDEDKLSYLSLQVDALRKDIHKNGLNEMHETIIKHHSMENELLKRLEALTSENGINISKAAWEPGKMRIYTTKKAPKELADKLIKQAEKEYMRLEVSSEQDKS